MWSQQLVQCRAAGPHSIGSSTSIVDAAARNSSRKSSYRDKVESGDDDDYDGKPERDNGNGEVELESNPLVMIAEDERENGEGDII